MPHWKAWRVTMFRWSQPTHSCYQCYLRMVCNCTLTIIYIQLNTETHTHKHTHTRTHTHTHTQTPTHRHTHTHAHTHTHTHTHTLTDTHTHRHTHPHTQIHTHTHTQPPTLPPTHRQTPQSIDWHGVLGRLERDGVHDEGDELNHVRLHLRLVQLVHQHHDDGQLRQHLQRLRASRNDVVLKTYPQRLNVTISMVGLKKQSLMHRPHPEKTRWTPEL